MALVTEYLIHIDFPSELEKNKIDRHNTNQLLTYTIFSMYRRTKRISHCSGIREWAIISDNLTNTRGPTFSTLDIHMTI